MKLATNVSMKQNESGAKAAKQQQEIFPWQAAVMVACLTAAGLFHEHPTVARPLVDQLHRVSCAKAAQALPPAEALNLVPARIR